MNNLIIQHGSYFITGIDTEIGKTYFTGLLAKKLKQQNQKIITQKLIQTGCHQYADDILKHREIMGIELLEHDLNFLTMPMILKYPCSPHLAIRLEEKMINLNQLYQTTKQLEQYFDIILIEGAGGLYVPITEDIFIIDYIEKYNYPVILVTSGRLGSINHTILSIEAILNRGLTLYAVVYNHIHDQQDMLIAQETQNFLKHYLQSSSPSTQWAVF